MALAAFLSRGVRRGVPWVRPRTGLASLDCRPKALGDRLRWFASNSDERWINVVEKDAGDVVDILISPLRHGIYTVNLFAFRQAFAGAYDPTEFREGALLAFRYIVERLDDPLTVTTELRHAVSEPLLEELNTRATEQTANPKGGKFNRLLEVKLHAIFTVRVKSDENGDTAVWITALLDALEEYVPLDGPVGGSSTVVDGVTVEEETPASGWHVRRLHKWAFKRLLPGEDNGDYGEWVVQDMSRWRWQPES